MSLKLCVTCENEKGEGEFHRNRSAPDGMHKRCKSCRQIEAVERRLSRGDTMRKRDVQRRKDWKKLTDRLKGFARNRCNDCNLTWPGHTLHFDHVDPDTKRFNIAHGWNYSFEVALAEVLKCELVCASCHAKRGHERGQLSPPPTDGTIRKRLTDGARVPSE